ncbi:hypothetical protein KGQ27_01935 [Patescibacteria group bacterium]|nr:hypothetical protein [Patescibacteria group bacterium]MDE1946322.1 hypothetical protein [Patescibacteria group bacterium]MDE2010774.1 hypothetical protein [Patescibacteria group bacterium]MDE2232659.1 hypothetical protein [Patescibacteria group bacterium]
MSFQSYLDNLREKPEHIRRHYAFWTSLGVTATIFAFWLASFTTLGNSTKDAVARVVNNTETPAQSLVASVGAFFGDIKDMVFGPKKINYSTVEVSPGER